MSAQTDEQRNPYEDANAHFEGVGRLYFRRYQRLRPGKDEPAECGRDSMDEDNLRQFQDWIKHEAFEDAIRRIDVLEAKLEACKDALEDIAGGAAMMLGSPPMPKGATRISTLHRYAAEVKRVADDALGRKPRG